MLRGASPAVQREFKSIDWHARLQDWTNIAAGLRTERGTKECTGNGLLRAAIGAEDHAT